MPRAMSLEFDSARAGSRCAASGQSQAGSAAGDTGWETTRIRLDFDAPGAIACDVRPFRMDDVRKAPDATLIA